MSDHRHSRAVRKHPEFAGITLAPGELPDPPDNLDFLDLPEDFQETIANRFAVGNGLRLYRDRSARQAWLDQVNTMLDKRRTAADAKAEARAKWRKKHMANRATVGELADHHKER